MSTIHLGRGSVVVEFPDEELMSGLSMFRHGANGSGEYESLYTFNASHNTLVTLPGFAQRVIRLSDRPRILDERVKMPEPDIASATDGIEDVWKDPIRKAIQAEGGVVSVPDILGTACTVAAILRAYPKERMIDRGTPMSIIASRDSDSARQLAYEIRRFLPDREVGIGRSDSDDVIVTSYKTLDDTPRHLAGVFIGEICTDDDLVSRAEYVSGFRNAARWAICSTPFGGPIDVGMPTEGLFGELSSVTTYDAAVKAGVGMPVTVCWLPGPRPNVPLGSADMGLMGALAMQENPAFVRMVSDIVRESAAGCLVHADNVAISKRIASMVPNLVEVHRKVKKSERRILIEDIALGTIARAVVTDEFIPKNIGHGVVVAATCRGADFVGKLFPWRKSEPSVEKTYIVDFTHAWDVHNGRPGILALNDEARKRRYRELGFGQLQIDDVSALPFIGSR